MIIWMKEEKEVVRSKYMWCNAYFERVISSSLFSLNERKIDE